MASPSSIRMFRRGTRSAPISTSSSWNGFTAPQVFQRAAGSNAPAIWLGDLNVAPEPIDVYHPDRRVNDPDFHIDARDATQRPVGLHRRVSSTPSGSRAVYLLGLLPQCVRSRLGMAHRPHHGHRAIGSRLPRDRRGPGNPPCAGRIGPCRGLGGVRFVTLPDSGLHQIFRKLKFGCRVHGPFAVRFQLEHVGMVFDQRRVVGHANDRRRGSASCSYSASSFSRSSALVASSSST